MLFRSGFLRRELGHSLQLRYTPELQFIADDSIAYGAHILEVLRDPEKVKPVNPDNDAVLPDDSLARRAKQEIDKFNAGIHNILTYNGPTHDQQGNNA